jgi:hypothetical protein
MPFLVTLYFFSMFSLSCIEIEYSWYDEGTASDKETCRVIFIIEFNHKDTSKYKSSSNFHSLICFIHYKIKEIKTEQDKICF